MSEQEKQDIVQETEQEPKEAKPMFTKEAVDKVKAESEQVRDDMHKYLEEEYGIKKEQIDDWKNKFKAIYVLFFDDEPYIVRGISRQEWKLINAKPVANRTEEMSIEEQVASKTVIYSKKPLDITEPSGAGLASAIFQTVLRLSKFEPDMPPMRL